MKSATMRYCNSGVISHEICNHEIQDIGNTSTDMNILDSTNQINKISPINSYINSNQSSQSIKTADQTSASFERFRSCSLENDSLIVKKNLLNCEVAPKCTFHAWSA